MRNSGNDSTRYLTKTQYQIPSPIIWTFNSFLYSSWWEFYSYYSVVVKVRHIYSFQEMFPVCKNMKIILADIKLWPGYSREERRQTITNCLWSWLTSLLVYGDKRSFGNIGTFYINLCLVFRGKLTNMNNENILMSNSRQKFIWNSFPLIPPSYVAHSDPATPGNWPYLDCLSITD